MKILITGGCGFIGSHLIEYHLNKGDEVFSIDNLSTGTMDNIALFQNNSLFTFEQADILTWEGLEELVSWANRIYHMAAVVGMNYVINHPISVLETNISGCDRLLKIIAQLKSQPRLMIASSSSVYGYSEKESLNENDLLFLGPPDHPPSGYSISKLADEALGLAYYQKYKTPLTLLRLFNTIGRRQTGRYGMVVPRFIQQACSNQPITIYGEGYQTRSFCDVRDTVLALDKLAENYAATGEIINVGNDEEISINKLAQLICERAKSKSKLTYHPFDEVYGKNFRDITFRRPDLSKIRRYIAHKNLIPLTETIDDLIADFKLK